MQLKTTLLSLFAVAATAAPTDGASCTAPPRKFGIMSLRSASPIHFGQVSAYQNNIALNLPEDQINAQCANGVSRKDATFYIKDGELFLYTPKDIVQKFFTDRSGMGQGVLQYVTYGKNETWTPGPRLETKGWAVDENDNLTFNGVGLLACPWDSTASNTKWYIWVAASSAPAGQQGCLGFNARTLTVDAPVQCTYSKWE
ncbi:hypothetical protein QBC43DRAFT_270748 [Cladorrhinum sp. PSN259]|nr:hypothetical protein QBC43DRAFT_270748 [Cladorrhinum sp. PSN259]